MALVENMPSGKAMKLGDVLKARNGKTIEVLNTDAEGRLILADALAYAVDLKANHLVDLATLTGACMVALGHDVAGLMSNDEAWSQKVLAASQAAGEKAWPLPMFPHYREMIKSDGGRHQEHRRLALCRRDLGGQVPGGIRRRDAVGPPRHRGPIVGGARERDARRGRHRLLRADAGGAGADILTGGTESTAGLLPCLRYVFAAVGSIGKHACAFVIGQRHAKARVEKVDLRKPLRRPGRVRAPPFDALRPKRLGVEIYGGGKDAELHGLEGENVGGIEITVEVNDRMVAE